MQYQEVTQQTGVLTKLAVALITQNPWAAFAINTAADAVVSGEIDLENVAKDAAFTYATAGVGEFGGPESFQGVSGLAKNTLNVPSIYDPITGARTVGYLSETTLQNIAVEAGTSSLSQTAIYGGSLKDNLGAGLTRGLIDEGTALSFKKIGDVKDDFRFGEGSLPGALLHGFAGCVSSEASGGTCGSGFVIASVNELASPYYDDGYVEDPHATAQEKERARKTYELARAYKLGVITGALTSGGDVANIGRGSGITTSAIVNNRQLHVHETEAIEKYADDYAVQQGYCDDSATCNDDAIARATGELTAENLRGVSDDFAQIKQNGAAREFLNGLNIAGDIVDGQTMFGQLDRNGDEYRNSTINMANFNDPKFLNLYTTLPRVQIASDGSTLDGAVYAMHGLIRSQDGGTDFVNFENSYAPHDLNELLAGQNAYLGLLRNIRDQKDSFDLARDFNVLRGNEGDSFAFGKEGLRDEGSAPFLDRDYFGEGTANYLYLNNAKEAEQLLTLGGVAATGAFVNVRAGLIAQRQISRSRSLDELSKLLDTRAVNNNITISGRKIAAEVQGKGAKGAQVFKDVTDADVFGYFKKISGATRMPRAQNYTIRGKNGQSDRTGTRYTVDVPGEGKFTLRNTSKSTLQSGQPPKWTIDVPGKAVNSSAPKKEIKFE